MSNNKTEESVIKRFAHVSRITCNHKPAYDIRYFNFQNFVAPCINEGRTTSFNPIETLNIYIGILGEKYKDYITVIYDKDESLEKFIKDLRNADKKLKFIDAGYVPLSELEQTMEKWVNEWIKQ
jgi:hypothetical protein